MILLSDPKIRQLESADCGAPMVDLRHQPDLLLDKRMADEDGAFARIRKPVAERLLAAQDALPDGLRVLIVEAYRPLHLQKQIFDGYYDRLRRTYPDWADERVHVEASKFVSPPEVAPHCTGGTVDLTLCTVDGEELDMGTEMNATPEDCASACFTAATTISPDARANRDLLVKVMTGAGMVNYPTEWWHYSYGDRYWALHHGLAATEFGPVDLETALRHG